MKKRVLILGADGMLGHKLFLALQHDFHVVGSVRSESVDLMQFGIFTNNNTLFSRDMLIQDMLLNTVRDAAPDIVINAIGIVKQRQLSSDVLISLELNSLLPHRIAQICIKRGLRLIHISTDCVFSGARGYYNESDIADAVDIYGRTKFLGEVVGDRCLTLRTSIVGLELTRFRSLIEWYLRQKGEVKGFRRAVFSGMSTGELSRLIKWILLYQENLSGLFHVASEPITKFELLSRFTKMAQITNRIIPDDDFIIDRSLDGSRFKQVTGYTVSSWDQMIAEIAQEFSSRKLRRE